MINFKDGYLTIKGAQIYCKFFESQNPSGRKLIVLHGGPGATHDADIPIAKLSEKRITVLFYDQYGSGKSGETEDFLSRLTTEYYVEELDEMRRVVFGDDKVFLLGHSWGGMLALAYAVEHQNLRGLITTGGLSSVPFYTQEVNKIIDTLPDNIKSVIAKYEAIGDFSNPEYLKAVDFFYHRHLCRLDKWPEEMNIGIKSIEERKVYKTWWGPNEFRATGNLKSWDITDQIGNISVPTLVTTGKYDEVSPNVARLIQRKIPASELVEFENSSHSPMWEEPESYLRVIEDFINQN